MSLMGKFFGQQDKGQVLRSDDLDKYIDTQRKVFEKEMSKIAIQAGKVRKDTAKAYRQSEKLSGIVDDVVKKIAVATGGMDGSSD